MGPRCAKSASAAHRLCIDPQQLCTISPSRQGNWIRELEVSAKSDLLKVRLSEEHNLLEAIDCQGKRHAIGL